MSCKESKQDKCPEHTAYSRCPECDAHYHIPKGYVLVSEHDVKLLNAATEWAEGHASQRS